MSHTRQIAEHIKADRLLFYSNFINDNDQWSASLFDKYLQEGDELGERMTQAFKLAFQKHDKVIIIGSDCPSLTTEIIEEAFQALKNYPFVVGPAMDGGYYLIGMNAFEPSIFKDIDWSTNAVFNQTLEHIKKLDKACYLLPELSDIDYEEDWNEYGWKV